MQSVTFNSLSLHVVESVDHVFLMPSIDVANGYGVSDAVVRSHKNNQSDELIEGQHFIMARSANNAAKTMWTKLGVITLGFFIKSERAKEFRKWAANYVLHGSKVDDDMKEIILSQNATIVQLSKEIEQIKIKQTQQEPKRAGYMDAMFLNEVLDLVGQAQYQMRESEVIIEALKRRQEGFDRFVRGVLKTYPNENVRDYKVGESYLVEKINRVTVETQSDGDFSVSVDCRDVSAKLQHLPPRPSTATRSNPKGQKRIGFTPRNKMRPEEIEVIKQMAQNGCTQSHIAEVVGCSVKTVQVYSR